MVAQLCFVGCCLPRSFVGGAFEAPAVSDVIFRAGVLARVSSRRVTPSAFLVASLWKFINRDQIACRGSDGYTIYHGDEGRWRNGGYRRRLGFRHFLFWVLVGRLGCVVLCLLATGVKRVVRLNNRRVFCQLALPCVLRNERDTFGTLCEGGFIPRTVSRRRQFKANSEYRVEVVRPVPCSKGGRKVDEPAFILVVNGYRWTVYDVRPTRDDTYLRRVYDNASRPNAVYSREGSRDACLFLVGR